MKDEKKECEMENFMKQQTGQRLIALSLYSAQMSVFARWVENFYDKHKRRKFFFNIAVGFTMQIDHLY